MTSDQRPDPPLNLTRWCLERTAEDPATRDRPAFTFVQLDAGGGWTAYTWTYEEVWDRVQRIGRGLLGMGLQPGDRVLVRLPHSPDYAFAFFGANVAGLVPIPASPQLTAEETAFLVEDSQCAAIVTMPEWRVEGFSGIEVLAGPAKASGALDALDGAGPLPDTHAEDPAFLIYTSGTTSRPKGVLHAQRTTHGRAMMREGWQGFGSDDVTMHAGTLNWSYTLGVGLMDPWAAQSHAVLVDGIEDPARWPELMAQLGVTVFVAVPTVYRQMLKYGAPEEQDLWRLRHVLCAGEPMPPALREEWMARVGTEMYESLGMTEVSTYISSGPVTPVRPGSPGRPQPGRRIAILEPDSDSTEPLPPNTVGLLAVHRSDPGLMLGYWRRPAEEALVYRGEWFTGGDLAAMDEDGYIWFHGRHDDIIKSFGYRLSPVEIEQVVESHPDVLEAAVVGVAIDEAKTLVTACVVPQPDVAFDERAVASYVEQHLAGYKRPHQYVVVEALPRTRNGKVQRRTLLEQLRAGA
jgi:acyl-coenzyme A synthetase/AMP-(fatty) acid ligase